MRITGKLIAASMLIGAAAGMYASKQLNKNNKNISGKTNDFQPSNLNFTVNSAHGRLANDTSSADTDSETAVNYEYDANITADKSSTPTNIYFSNAAENPQPEDQGLNNTDNSIKIDMI
jgi:hypothetical protein